MPPGSGSPETGRSDWSDSPSSCSAGQPACPVARGPAGARRTRGQRCRVTMASMEGPDFQSVLGDLRAELDALDRRLVLLLKERAEVIARVVERKAAAGLGPVDIERERAMLAAIEARAEEVGLDPRVAGKILRAVIEAFTELETRRLG